MRSLLFQGGWDVLLFICAIFHLKIGDNHNVVTFIEIHPGDDNLMYIGEQTGKVYLYEDGKRRVRPFLDLTSDVLLSEVSDH